MSVVDFLFEGSAPTPGTTTGTTTVQLPEWYTQYTTDLLGRAQAVANLPYAQYPGPRIAGFTPTERTGFEATKAAAGAYQPFLGQAGATLGQAGAISGLGAAEPGFTQAAGMMGAPAAQPFLGRAAGMTGAGAAAPFFGAAARTFPQAVQEYMSPYIQNVVEQIGDIGVRQLQEKYLPEIGKEFIQAGQFGVGPGSSRMGEFGARALRDVQQSVLAEQAKALQAGYGQAADIYGRDVSRLADIGSQLGQLTGQDATRIAEIGRATGTLTQQDAQNLARIAESRGQLSQQDAVNLQALASKYLGLGEASQTMGLRGAEAVTGVGAKERAMQQANLDLAYQDFLRQQGYPEDRVKFLSETLKGISLPSTTVEQKIEALPQPGGASGLEQAISGFTGINTLLDLFSQYFPSGSSDINYDFEGLDDYFSGLLGE